jgi:hypothetical protein
VLAKRLVLLIVRAAISGTCLVEAEDLDDRLATRSVVIFHNCWLAGGSVVDAIASEDLVGP